MEGIRIVCPYTSCNDCSIMHSTSAAADPELVGGGGGGLTCMLLLHPVLTCAEAGPDLCTLHPDLCTLHPDLCTLCLRGSHRQQLTVVVFLPQPLAQRLPLHPLQLALVMLFLPLTDADTGLTLGQLALCGSVFLVVFFGGDGGKCMCMWRWWLYLRGGSGG